MNCPNCECKKSNEEILCPRCQETTDRIDHRVRVVRANERIRRQTLAQAEVGCEER